MGMAASQARFLGLTARKNNVEFEGQQVNQQRTTLSNESANYYNDLLGMSVPTPPSVDDYTKTTYTYADGALTNTLTSMIPASDGSGTYSVSYMKSYTDDFALVSSASSVVTKSGTAGAYTYSVGAKTLRTLDNKTEMDNLTSSDTYLKTLTDDERTSLLDQESTYLKLLQSTYGKDTEWYVRYVQNASTSAWSPIFYNKTTIDGASYDDNGNSQSSVDCYTIGSKTKTEEVKNKKGVKVEKDSTGRYISITFPQYDENGNVKTGTTDQTYSLTTNTSTDEDAYNDAMNEYEFKKEQYDQSIQR